MKTKKINDQFSFSLSRLIREIHSESRLGPKSRGGRGEGPIGSGVSGYVIRECLGTAGGSRGCVTEGVPSVVQRGGANDEEVSGEKHGISHCGSGNKGSHESLGTSSAHQQVFLLDNFPGSPQGALQEMSVYMRVPQPHDNTCW